MKLYGVEYLGLDDEPEEGLSTYEIFETLTEAKYFMSSNDIVPLYIFTADFNDNRIYKESGTNNWNYDDRADTFDFSTHKIIEDYRKVGVNIS